MSVYKGLNRSDVFLTDYISRKKWIASGSNLEELGLRLLQGVSSSRPYYTVDEDIKEFRPYTGTVGITSSYTEGKYNRKLLFGSIYEQFYSGSLEDGTFYGDRNLSLQTTLTVPGSRRLITSSFRDTKQETWIPGDQREEDNVIIMILSIPKEVFGNAITPGSFKVNLDKDVWTYVEDDYVANEHGSICDEGYPEGVYTRPSNHWVDPYFEDLHQAGAYDYEGVLIVDGFVGEWHQPEEYKYPTPIQVQANVVGDIIYNQGLVIFTNPFVRFLFENWDAETFEWEGSRDIYTKHIVCKARDIDFNKTFNPTATEELQNTEGFTPYVTTVGLYNSRGDLLAVAKLSKPIKKALDTEMTFDIQIDLG